MDCLVDLIASTGGGDVLFCIRAVETARSYAKRATSRWLRLLERAQARLGI